MKKWSELFAEEIPKWIVHRIIWGIVLLLMPIGLAVWHWGRQLLETPKLLKATQYSLFAVAAILIIAGLIAHYIGLRKNLSEAKRNADEIQSSLEKERQKAQSGQYTAILRSQQQPQRPSPMAFHVLKYFDQLSETQSADVQTVAHQCGLSREEALACVQELWNLKFIQTVVPAPGEWNGRYAITTVGWGYVIENAT